MKKKVERRGHLGKWRWQKWVAEKGGRRRNVSGILDGWVASSLQLWWTWTHSSSTPLPSSSLPSWLASSLPLFSAPSSLPLLYLWWKAQSDQVLWPMWHRTTQNVKLVLHHGQSFGQIFLDKPNIEFIYTTFVWGDIYIFLTRLGIGLRPESMEAPKVSMRKAISVKMLKNSFEHMVMYWCKIHSMVIMILM